MLLVSVATNKGSSHAGTSFLHAQKALLNQEFCPFRSISPAAFLQFKWFVFFRSWPKTSILYMRFFSSILFLDLRIPVFYKIQIQFCFILHNKFGNFRSKKKMPVAKSWQFSLRKFLLLLLVRQINKGFY